MREQILEEIATLETRIAETRKKEQELIATLTEERRELARQRTAESLGRPDESGLKWATHNVHVSEGQCRDLRHQIEADTAVLTEHRNALSRMAWQEAEAVI